MYLRLYASCKWIGRHFFYLRISLFVDYSKGAIVLLPLTTQQRDIIRKLLKFNESVIVVDAVPGTGLTSRQINYSLSSIRTWLTQRGIILETTPGVGVEILCSDAQRSDLLYELASQLDFQLILTSGQRQQISTICLSTDQAPLIFNWFEYIGTISMPTSKTSENPRR